MKRNLGMEYFTSTGKTIGVWCSCDDRSRKTESMEIHLPNDWYNLVRTSG